MLKQFDTNSLVTALIGASPKTNHFCERLFSDMDFEIIRNNIGRIRIEAVEDMQKQIVAMMMMLGKQRQVGQMKNNVHRTVYSCILRVA